MGRCLPGAQTRVGARLEFDELVLGIGAPATYRATAPRGTYFLTSSWPVKPVNLPISPEVPPTGLSAIHQTTDVVVTTLKSMAWRRSNPIESLDAAGRKVFESHM